MSEPVAAEPVLRIVGCLTGCSDLLAELEPCLEERFGAIALRSPPYRFDLSPYYAREMGPELHRYWYSFEQLFSPELVPESRRFTGQAEERFSREGRRRVNLDPGYLDHGKLVLASWKQAPDKIYLGTGVWAHVCLRFRSGRFEAPDHSFPDFRDGRYAPFFTQARGLYRRLLARGKSGAERSDSVRREAEE
ncbi:MAG: DUF4416 family protein [Armatimonadetes bacterium]|nr:DUF4416 family protein [Armatimonadota bacterium]